MADLREAVFAAVLESALADIDTDTVGGHLVEQLVTQLKTLWDTEPSKRYAVGDLQACIDHLTHIRNKLAAHS